jgi:L-malate glycosyltransferase
MKINIIGYLGFHNIGDDLMLIGLLNELNNRKCFSINIFMKDEVCLKSYIDNWTNLTINIIKLSTVTNIFLPYYIFSSDSTIWCGGTCFYEDPNDKQLNGLKWIKKIAFYTRIFKKNLFFLNIGANNLITLKSKKIMHNIIKSTTAVSVRDLESLNNLQNYFLDNDRRFIGGDLAFLSMEPRNFLRDSGDYILFCGHNQYTSDKTVVEFYAKNLVELSINLNKKIIFFPFHGGKNSDNLFHLEICKFFKLNVEYKIIEETNLDNMVGMFKKAYIVISMRLHALIFSELLSKPNIGINYNNKVAYFIEKTKNISESRIKEVGDEILAEDARYVCDNYKSNNQFIIKERHDAIKGIIV